MRVTERMMFDVSIANVDRAESAQQTATQIAETGIRVTQPGDDPVAAGLIVQHGIASRRFDAISQGVSRASDELNTADGALNGLSNLLSQAQTLAVQMSNATYSASDRASAATQITDMTTQAISLLNTESGGRYLFGGDKDGSPPFDASGNYLGDANTRQVEIAPGVMQAASVRADVAVKGVGGGVDVLSTLSSLATALSSNDVAGVQSSLDALATGINQVSQARSGLGASVAVLESASAANQAAKTSEDSTVSNLADADEITAASQLTQTQTALQAAISAAQQGFHMSLVDKLDQ